MLTLNAFQLRWYAEMAASRRSITGDPLWLVAADVGTENPDVTLVSAPVAPADAVFGVETFDVNPDRPPVSSVSIESEGAERELFPDYDAVFWTESAVEKFVLPYYANKSLWEAAKILYRLSYHWYDRPPLEIPVDPTDRVGSQPLTSVPFAVAHTPDSEYAMMSINDAVTRGGHDTVTPGGVPPLGWETALLFRGRDGKVHARRLSDLPDPPAEWRRRGR